MSQPWIVAFMAQLLELKGDETVLEVGTGSGYGAAVLSRLCRHVVTVERHEALAERARATLAELGYANVDVRAGDGTRGVPELAPFTGRVDRVAAETGILRGFGDCQPGFHAHLRAPASCSGLTSVLRS